ncbi:hypothetical protein PpBr36_07224 [Pyricularia pennisetigena]|uniref:hypothetical protein n=1 Tax=Pyricularia pennisetigena TaxID=1578925 RepID=UPI001151AC8B|nr:hypothetical protein PpBr36_07224 [Pyricularia pennisetigena]TLS25410.1 hypothetical protein PpBr36_07224 [Pyricularia pennisetigena]
MPTTRRSASAQGAAGKQSKLSFTHRVTKPVAPAGKKKLVSSPLVKELPSEKKLDPEPEIQIEQEEEFEIPAPVEAVKEKSEAEIKAEKITSAQIRKYWKGVEAQRLAPRVHQEDLDVGEKVLRYFDVSSQYGPCIGSSRKRRWMRAQRLGLNPPIEALAVLVHEEAAGKDEGSQRAYIDEIMNSTAIGAGSS